MKYSFLIAVLLFPIYILAQDYDLSSMQGLKDDKGNILLEISGYNISLDSAKEQVTNPKTIKSIKKKQKLTEILAEYQNEELGQPNKIIEAESLMEDRPNVKASQVIYLFNKNEKEVSIVTMQTLNQRDIALEKTVINEYLKNELSEYISSDLTANTINFAGREIELGSACKWMSPHNIHCMGGQISWAEFPSFESAELDINTRIKANDNNKTSTILDEEDLDVIFEGIPSLAHRVVYMPTGYRRYPLVVYYIVQEVRGRYISCTLSNYGYNRNDYELAPLLQEVMSIAEIPETAHRQFDIPDYEDRIPGSYDSPVSWEIRASSWMPMDNLRKTFKVAPTIGFYMGSPLRKKYGIDLGVSIGIPINSNKFDYYRHNEIYETKADIMVGFSIRGRYEQQLAKNVFWRTYIGVGGNSIQTDLKKEYYDDDESKWYWFETIDLYGGASVRYKKVGCFLEYHYTPYSIANRVRSSFGNSAVNIGINVVF